MSLTPTLVLYCVLILLASLLGGWIPFWVRMTHKRMELAVSFVGGVMLGVGIFHMIPHAFHETHSIDRVVWWVLVGLIVMFLVERFFCYHHHPAVPEDGDAGPAGAACGHDHHHAHDAHDHGHDPEHAGPDDEPGAGATGHRLSWSGALTGLTLHTLLAGVALAASAQAESHGGNVVGLAGFGTFLVIFLHKPLDSMTIGTLLAAGQWSVRFRHIVNVMFALVIPIGVTLFYVGLHLETEAQHVFVGCALAFSAGTFLCISLSDLLPELHFHRHDRVKLSMALLLGLAIAYSIGLFEASGHDHHGEPAAPVETQQQPDAHDNDHDH
jgi:zinc and cadmium transporter